MAGISSKAAGVIENKKKYQQYELNTDFDINLYESFYRSNDPQLGRFWQIDPKPNEFESPYTSMGNNPIINFDLLGDTINPRGSYTTDGTPYKDALNILKKSESFKSLLTSLDVEGNNSFFSNSKSGDYSSKINISFMDCTECETHTGTTITGIDGKQYEEREVAKNLDKFDNSSVFNITIFTQQSYIKGDKRTIEGVVFDVKHEVGVHAIFKILYTAKEFVDNGAKSYVELTSKLRKESAAFTNPHGYASSGDNKIYSSMGLQVRKLFTSSQLKNYNSIAQSHYSNYSGLSSYRKLVPGPTSRIAPNFY